MKRFAVVLLLLASAASGQEKKVSIVKAGPIGELATLAEANEVRVVFSAPMVAVGKIPKNLTIPWFHITPNVKGTFRWSGTTTLIFTPEQQLPYATKYDVAIDAPQLDRPYSFSFITPTIQLQQTTWYRKGETADAPVVIGLIFNQPVEKATLAPHFQLRTAKHEFKEPQMPGSDPAYAAKLAKAKAAADSDGVPVMSFFTDEWDEKHFGHLPKDRFLAVETKPGVQSGTNLQVFIDDQLAKGESNIRTGRAQTYTIELVGSPGTELEFAL